MKPGGLFFCHVFCHKVMPYHFEVRSAECPGPGLPSLSGAIDSEMIVGQAPVNCTTGDACPLNLQDNGDDDWMTRYFFTGGTMPSLDLFLYFQEHLKVQKVAYINGVHYSKCLEAWLALQDKQRAELMPIFKVRD
jgi:cyclopropane fatty-acyl-phospholipid synthase-like methyltransferase